MAAPLRFDLVVAGATAPGIVAAVRAAREGLKVALVSAHRHVGGVLPSLGAIETHYAGNRAPLLEEIMERIKTHYAVRHGLDSEAYRTATGGGKVTGGMLTFEPQIAEAVCEALVVGEGNITLWRGLSPVGADVRAGAVHAVSFATAEGDAVVTLAAPAFIEAGYEGDLMALAGAEFRIGRESRTEFNEPSAGRIFARWVPGCHPRDAAEGRLNIITKNATTEAPLPGSTGEGDGEVQNYSYRICLSQEPENRRIPDAPPPEYDRSQFAPILLPVAEKEKLRLPFHHRLLIYTLEETAAMDHVFHGHALPNGKRSWNATNLTGGSREYPAAGAPERRKIELRHRGHALGLMYFLQHDRDVPEPIRRAALEWGLARDEFVATDNFPPQLYVREARRLRGRAVFTEHDALVAPGLGRAPIHPDSIGITEFSLDSLACTMDRVPGSLCDGQLFPMETSRPGQVPWGVLLPRDLENLIVINTVSATHVGWGTIRQLPTLMHLAESAAWAIVLAARDGVPPAQVGVDRLQRQLAARGVMLTFCNEFDMACGDPWVPAMQYLGAKGFFSSYDARPEAPLTRPVAALWARAVPVLARPGHDANLLARAVHGVDRAGDPIISRREFLSLLGRGDDDGRASLTRAEACRICHEVSLPPPRP